METIYYTKQFTSGNLKGLSVPAKLTRDLTAQQIAKIVYVGKKGRDVLTHDRWIITDASFQNYQR